MASLLADIRALSEEEFRAVIGEMALPASVEKPKRASQGKAKKVAKDSPAARIAKVLADRGLAGHDAQAWLRSALERDGIDAAELPAVASDVSLEEWLTRLLERVQSPVAFEVARTATLR